MDPLDPRIDDALADALSAAWETWDASRGASPSTWVWLLTMQALDRVREPSVSLADDPRDESPGWSAHEVLDRCLEGSTLLLASDVWLCGADVVSAAMHRGILVREAGPALRAADTVVRAELEAMGLGPEGAP